ncbi:MAG: hypothetical protein CNE89_10940 [Sphingomonadaceae bacterium MED-G03]|nr:hypothetical protein [Erythrobacter sp.]PDH65678.1 MAG: hypothetical protein CNE89_10940 [Sphingomonadaceae bacterium MED-G03]
MLRIQVYGRHMHRESAAQPESAMAWVKAWERQMVARDRAQESAEAGMVPPISSVRLPLLSGILMQEQERRDRGD